MTIEGENFRLIQGDCIEVLKEMEDNSIDVIITDPPFGINFQSSWKIESKRYAKIINDEFPFIEWLPEAYKKLKRGGRLLMFYRYDVQDVFFDAISATGMEIKSQIVWDKVIHGLGDLNGQFAPQHELIVYATKGRYEFINGRPKSIYREQRVPIESQIHPTEKPVQLLRRLLHAISTEGDNIFEPFMGSGSMAIASIIENRSFIGCEISEEYFWAASKRIENHIASHPRLFTAKEINNTKPLTLDL